MDQDFTHEVRFFRSIKIICYWWFHIPSNVLLKSGVDPIECERGRFKCILQNSIMILVIRSDLLFTSRKLFLRWIWFCFHFSINSSYEFRFPSRSQRTVLFFVDDDLTPSIQFNFDSSSVSSFNRIYNKENGLTQSRKADHNKYRARHYGWCSNNHNAFTYTAQYFLQWMMI